MSTTQAPDTRLTYQHSQTPAYKHTHRNTHHIHTCMYTHTYTHIHTHTHVHTHTHNTRTHTRTHTHTHTHNTRTHTHTHTHTHTSHTYMHVHTHVHTRTHTHTHSTALIPTDASNSVCTGTRQCHQPTTASALGAYLGLSCWPLLPLKEHGHITARRERDSVTGQDAYLHAEGELGADVRVCLCVCLCNR